MENIVIQKIIGGLGNQMFQYAFIKALSLRNNADFKLDISSYEFYKTRPYELEIFNIKNNYTFKKEIPFYERIGYNYKYMPIILLRPLLRKLNKYHFKERWGQGIFEKDFLKKNKGYFDGFFQSEEYFKDFGSEIRSDFSFKGELSEKNKKILNILKEKNTCSVHIRRGDYLNNPNFCVCSLDYYNKAIKYIHDKVEKTVFLFFSDDMEWVKENFKGNNYYYVDHNIGKNSWQDMSMMSKCKHNIIANSSFSRWGARLNNNSNKIVVRPSNITKIYNEMYYPKNYIYF